MSLTHKDTDGSYHGDKPDKAPLEDMSAHLKDVFGDMGCNLNGGAVPIQPGDLPIAGDEHVRRDAPNAEMLSALVRVGGTILGVVYRNGHKGDAPLEVSIVKFGENEPINFARVSLGELNRVGADGAVTPYRDIILGRDNIDPNDDTISRRHGVIRVHSNGRVEVADGVPSEHQPSTNGTIVVRGDDLTRYVYNSEGDSPDNYFMDDVLRLREQHNLWTDPTLRVRNFGSVVTTGSGIH